MQTHCPNCDTRFRVTDTQIDVADGFVRCGVCEHVFNVYEVTEQASLDDEHQPSLLHEDHAQEKTTEYTDDQALDITAERDSELYAAEETDEATTEKSETFSSFENLPDDDSDDLSDKLSDKLSGELTGEFTEELSEKLIPDNFEKDTFNFFEDNDDNSTGHVVPEEFRDSYISDTHSTVSNVLWSIGILFLTVTLFIEYAWFNRNQFSHIPEIQAEIDKLCQQFDCEKLSLRAPSKIELVARNVYSHPNEKNVLMVNITMKNNASFSQPYPVLKIDFSDIRGGHVASRNFLPGEYLPREYLTADDQQSDNKQPLLAPDASSNITMEIVDPGKQALTYEFNFL
ncbi:MAG: DUF3426 domain-containing protein [Gammaproteobacteria bacterium]